MTKSPHPVQIQSEVPPLTEILHLVAFFYLCCGIFFYLSLYPRYCCGRLIWKRWTVILLSKIMIEMMFWPIDIPIWTENTIENEESSYKFLAYINHHDQCCLDLLEMCSKSVKFDGSLGLQKTTKCITSLLFICLWVG